MQLAASNRRQFTVYTMGGIFVGTVIYNACQSGVGIVVASQNIMTTTILRTIIQIDSVITE